MATQYEPIVKDSTLNTTEQTPRNLADVLASGLANIANNVKPDGSDISIDVPGMSATNVNDGFSELKQSLDNLDGLKTVTNLNTITTSGVCKYDGGSTGAPTTNGGVVLTIYNTSSNQAVQIAQANNQSYTSIRRRHADWTAWDKIALESSLDDLIAPKYATVTGYGLTCEFTKTCNVKMVSISGKPSEQLNAGTTYDICTIPSGFARGSVSVTGRVVANGNKNITFYQFASGKLQLIPTDNLPTSSTISITIVYV